MWTCQSLRNCAELHSRFWTTSSKNVKYKWEKLRQIVISQYLFSVAFNFIPVFKCCFVTFSLIKPVIIVRQTLLLEKMKLWVILSSEMRERLESMNIHHVLSSCGWFTFILSLGLRFNYVWTYFLKCFSSQFYNFFEIKINMTSKKYSANVNCTKWEKFTGKFGILDKTPHFLVNYCVLDVFLMKIFYSLYFQALLVLG